MEKIKKIGSFIFILFFTYLLLFAFSFALAKTDSFIRETKKSDEFSVYPKNVIIEGIEKISREEILLLAGLDRKKSYFDISEKKGEVFLYTNRWIKKCSVKKMFPNTIKILIEEYKPAMIVNSIERRNGHKELYSLWFADKDGLVFKKALPHETKNSLPFFYIDMKISEGENKKEKIKKAVDILAEWKNVNEICTVNRIYFDMVNNYTIDCEFKNGIVLKRF